MGHSQQDRVEQHLLLGRLKDIKTTYAWDLCCMRHPQIPPRTNHNLGDQWIGANRREKYILDLRVTWNWQNVVSTFDLREPSR